MVGQIFRDVALTSAKTQSKLINSLTEEAPILAALPVQPTSHGLYNVYEELIDVASASSVDLDEALPEVSAESKLRQVDMKVLGAIMTVGEDKARLMGGAGRYFSQNAGPVLKKTGSNMERSLIYNTFRAGALANHNPGANDIHVINAGGAAGKNYSIVVVHYSEGEVTGLYDPQGFGNGKVFDLKEVNGGNLYKDGDGRLVYGLRMKSYFGVQTANKRYLSAIVNIDPSAANTSVTAAMLDDAIENARGRPENTLIYMHPKALNQLYGLKGGIMQVTARDRDMDRTFISWNGVEIVTSYNFLKGTEANVSVAV